MLPASVGSIFFFGYLKFSCTNDTTLFYYFFQSSYPSSQILLELFWNLLCCKAKYKSF